VSKYGTKFLLKFNQLPSNPLNTNLKDTNYKTIELIQKYELHEFFCLTKLHQVQKKGPSY